MKLNKIFTLVILFCFLQSMSGQNSGKKSDKMLTITGKVFNIDKTPVEGAVFFVDNVKTSYRTRSNGSYKIKISSTAANLEARSPEFGSCEITLNGQTNIDFTLNGITDSQDLNTDVKDKEKSAVEGSSAPPKAKAKKMNTYANIYQMIRAEVSGVLVSGRSIQIQQAHSFFGSGEPLYVVNGVIVTTIDNINPIEVKSIKVLKGSSAAIYGVRGANGVLSITLLNGSETNK